MDLVARGMRQSCGCQELQLLLHRTILADNARAKRWLGLQATTLPTTHRMHETLEPKMPLAAKELPKIGRSD